MHWQQDWVYIYGNRLPITTFITLVVTALVKTAPISPKEFSWYFWAYDFLHQFLNINNTRLVTAPIITPPGPTEDVVPGPKQ